MTWHDQAQGETPAVTEMQTRAWIDTLLAAHANDLPLTDEEHAIRCAQFAAALFDATAAALDLPPSDRRLAIAGALWHDVGYARDARDHARKSFDMILNARLPEFTEDERTIIACVARYHRRLLPNIEHAGFGTMSREDQRRVRRLAGVVRLAVALDASHLGLVDHIVARVVDGTVTLMIYARSDAEMERDRLVENGAAFRQLTHLRFDFEIVVDRRPQE